MFLYAIVVAAFLQEGYGERPEVYLPENDTVCLNKLVEWCNNMNYSTNKKEEVVEGITFTDPSGYYDVYCLSDTNGTVCSASGLPLFSCLPGNEFRYKGKLLTKNSTIEDDMICETAELAFNELLVQNLPFSMKPTGESFYDKMREQIAAAIHEIQNYLGIN